MGAGAAARPAATSYSTAGKLNGVAAASASSAWAVGSAGNSSPKVLMLHWNGTAWSRVTSPKVLNGTAGQLTAVTVVSATNAWAVGFTGVIGSGKDHTLILRWNGSTWSRVTARLGKGAGFNGVAVTAPNTAWAIGMPVAMITGALARWNGSAWRWVKSFPVQGPYHPLEGIAAGPGGTAFAVGDNNDTPGPAISMRWTGKAWQQAPVSAPSGSQLNAVAFAPGGTAWAAGGIGYGTGGTLIVRWYGALN